MRYAKPNTYIYGLVDPRDDQVRYIGRSVDPIKRLTQHMRGARLGLEENATEKECWIYEVMREANQGPRVVVFEVCSYRAAVIREWQLISKISKTGHYLTNVEGNRPRLTKGPLQRKYAEIFNWN